MQIICRNCQNAIEVEGDGATSTLPLCRVCGSSLWADAELTISMSDAPQQRQIGRFELIARVGMGAYGEVHKARDGVLGRVVAVKIPRLAGLTSSAEVERFLREARSMAQLRHPGIVPVHEVGYADGVPFLVSEFIDGVTLGDRLTAGLIAPRQAAEIAAAVADALQYAHEHKIIHRDVKPSNIMFGNDGSIRLMDFGMAKCESGEATMTTEGQLLGTPAYMSPEQARGESHLVDGRSDVYALGVVLYQMLAGELPFRGNPHMVMHQVLHDEPRPPHTLNDRIPRDLEMICLKAMSKEPGHRYESAGDMARDLRNFLEGQPVTARPVSILTRAWLWCRRADRIRDAGAIAVFLGVILTLWTTYDMIYYGLIAPASRPWEALRHRLILTGLFFVPIALVGLRTLRGGFLAVWGGAFFGVLGLTFATLFRYQERFGLNLRFGGAYDHAAIRVPIAALFSILSFILTVVYIIAITSYYSNRHSLRWRQSAGKSGTSSARPAPIQ